MCTYFSVGFRVTRGHRAPRTHRIRIIPIIPTAAALYVLRRAGRCNRLHPLRLALRSRLLPMRSRRGGRSGFTVYVRRSPPAPLPCARRARARRQRAATRARTCRGWQSAGLRCCWPHCRARCSPHRTGGSRAAGAQKAHVVVHQVRIGLTRMKGGIQSEEGAKSCWPAAFGSEARAEHKGRRAVLSMHRRNPSAKPTLEGAPQAIMPTVSRLASTSGNSSSVSKKMTRSLAVPPDASLCAASAARGGAR